MKKSEVKNKHKNKDGKLKTILSIWHFKRNKFPDGRLMKHISRLCTHGVMQLWVVNYCKTYSPVVNLIIVKSLLSISSTHKFPSRSIDFVPSFPQGDIDLDVFM